MSQVSMKRQGRRWKPTLIGASRQAAIEAVDAIADALQPAMESWGKRWDDPAGIDNASMACGRVKRLRHTIETRR